MVGSLIMALDTNNKLDQIEQRRIMANPLCNDLGYVRTYEQCKCAIACDERGLGWNSPCKRDMFGRESGCCCLVTYELEKNHWETSNDIVLW